MKRILLNIYVFVTATAISIFPNSNIAHPIQRDYSRWSRINTLTEPFPTNVWWEPLAIGSDVDSNANGDWYPVTTYPYQFQFADNKLLVCVLNTSLNQNNIFQTGCQSTWFFLPREENSLYIDSFTNTSLDCAVQSPNIQYHLHIAQGMPSIHLNITYIHSNVFNMTTWPPIQSFTKEETTIYRITLTNGNQWVIFVPIGSTLWQTTYNEVAFRNGEFLRLLFVEPHWLLQTYQYPYSHLTIQTTSQSLPNGSTEYTYSPQNWKDGNFSFYALLHHVHLQTSDSCMFIPTSLISSHGNVVLAICNKPLVLTLHLPSDAINHPYHYPDIPSKYLDTLRTAFVDDVCTTLSMYVSTDCSSGVYWIGKSIHRLSLSIQLADQIGEIAIRNTLVVKLYDILISLFTQGFVYEQTWGGVVCLNDLYSVNNNYGCGWYNDHHFQYGYIIFAGAVVSEYNSTCIQKIKPYIDELVQDISKRHFNWFLGHSWATGLFASERNQESSSEAIQAYWAMYLWGKVTKQSEIKDAGQAMVLLETYTTHMYYFPLLNSLYPLPYGSRSVTGVLFDTWIWYSTFFGSNSEYIHGIHFLPYGTHHLLRYWPTYYTKEWTELQSTQTGDWKPIVYGILSQINQTTAWTECVNAKDSDFDLFSPRSIVLWFIATMGL
jgi:endo-1,3(4)-beta-glucanase